MTRPGTGTAIVVMGLVYGLALVTIIGSVAALWPVSAPASPSAVAQATSPAPTSSSTGVAPSSTVAPTEPAVAPTGAAPTDPPAQPTARPTPRVTPRPPILVTELEGTATFYCLPGVSPCTIGHVGGLYAAAGPELRAALGDWRGRKVTVWRGDTHVTVTLIDFCECPDAAIDLYADAFLVLGPLALGVLEVDVRWEV